ncbi:MAG TPA: hypothetical protein VH816_17920 [Gaiellaceae bacterium]|jgi:hypothetical protein
MSLRRGALVVTAIIAALACVPAALADGDPASDYLLSQQTFLPFDAKIPAATSEQLAGLVRNANEHGYKIRLAVIATRYDLGAVTALWKQPKTYASFLAAEIAFVYKGPLLIVMPNGLGFHAPGGATKAGYRTLADVRPASGISGLMTAAVSGVEKLAAAHGVQVRPPVATAAPAKGDDRIRLAILIAVVGGVIAVVLVLRWLAHRRFSR